MNSRSIFSVPARLIGHSSFLRAKAEGGGKRLNLPSPHNVPVEADTEKLAKYVCGSNLLSEGGEDVKIKPDSEYPEWLFKITSPPPLEELDKNTKTYWNRIRTMKERQIKYLRSLDKTSTVHK